MTEKAKVYVEPFYMRRLGPELSKILRDQLDYLCPRLNVGTDRSTFTPGFAFEGMVSNAYRKRSLTKLSDQPSGDVWFSVAMDTTSDVWAVQYIQGEGSQVKVVTPAAELYWVHETRGLAETVIRPLFIDWVLRKGLTREFGAGYADHLETHEEYRRYSRGLILLYQTFGIRSR
ncbi:hypothetical protein QO021_28575 (plasmid) [Pseudomonas amygdali pv. lachrymans]|uniref:Uncharacterized protein n=1 Tax=Pseudomonas syringae pv. maculicola str. ES4326 TaxID=629265 RepID=A0A8T8C9T8_PSEYM|nr:MULTISPECIES: hypothetical protein [Pseudomonas syringae group]QHF00396.1 hypothetical protein PMA4326_028155 [Pseudomonas syringae pv. maculicola str. ES4326]RMM39044.1 hypothetical protein ALQ79_200548 [Pseudomonas amygdali pv. lachrymans]UBZ00369.1 hypothetical protein LCG56_28800 [Pseudomonas cannabina pv. alisalensis]WIO61515.1 hypothetical protein QO021_28575 [Pseudomonas amygdali pv. lachrymans]